MQFDVGINTEFEPMDLFLPFATRLPDWKGDTDDFMRKFDLKLYQPLGAGVRFKTAGSLRFDKRSLKKVFEYKDVVVIPTRHRKMLFIIENDVLKNIDLINHNICLINIRLK